MKKLSQACYWPVEDILCSDARHWECLLQHSDGDCRGYHKIEQHLGVISSHKAWKGGPCGMKRHNITSARFEGLLVSTQSV